VNEYRRARRDVAHFAEVLLGMPLWPHQLEVVRSRARMRVICSGRQAGKSSVLAVLGLHKAFAAPGSFVLIVSAGEQAAKDLLGVCSRLALGSPLLSGSVVDDSKSELVLSNGSVVRSVPASTKQVRGLSADLLVLDEAAFVDDELWVAARFSTIARTDSRIVLASTPFGRMDRFFAVNYKLGLAGEKGYASFHWPSTVSPLVDAGLIEQWRVSDPERVFKREVLAEFVDDQGAYFSAAELDTAVRDFELLTPATARGIGGLGAVDWGFSNDANAFVIVSPVGARADEFGCPRHAWFVSYVDEQYRMTYDKFVGRVVETAKAFGLRRVASETNGVGQAPTQLLAAQLGGRVLAVHTDARLKENGFGAIKVLLQQGRLILPRHPQLLFQLSALEFETTDTGLTRISVPERSGHDDVAMAMCLAASADPRLAVASPGVRLPPRTPRTIGKVKPGARSTRGGDFEVTFGDGTRRRVDGNDWRVRAARRIVGRH
jgi:hypothetical protein